MSVTIYHNPRCSSSRQALALLTAKGIDIEIIEYLKTPPSTATLKNILELLKLTPRELMRKNEKEYKDLQLDNEKLTDAALIKAMHTHPILIQRPIVINGKKACIARPPETLMEIVK